MSLIGRDCLFLPAGRISLSAKLVLQRGEEKDTLMGVGDKIEHSLVRSSIGNGDSQFLDGGRGTRSPECELASCKSLHSDLLVLWWPL